jgi:hypothetical protein
MEDLGSVICSMLRDRVFSVVCNKQFRNKKKSLQPRGQTPLVVDGRITIKMSKQIYNSREDFTVVSLYSLLN